MARGRRGACRRGSKSDSEQADRFASCQAATAIGASSRPISRSSAPGQLDAAQDASSPRRSETTNPELCRAPAAPSSERVWRADSSAGAPSRRATARAALITIAADVIARYRAEKDRRGLLDYDDLIDKTLALLANVSAAWVHYKLDRGIDHVLIDEAQDTSPKQWEIISALVGGILRRRRRARFVKRTIFAVGDEKQSIFSFQGAAPREFAEMRRHFERAHRERELEFVYRTIRAFVPLRARTCSARSTRCSRARASSRASPPTKPACRRTSRCRTRRRGWSKSGRCTSRTSKREIEGWDAPFDDVAETSPQVRLARKHRQDRRLWQRQGTRPGDVLVLVRRRGPLFEAIIRALKNEDIAVAGADRLVLTEHIAVMDLMALADALLLPDDDLALATVLKSPLFGLDDEQLFALAWDRKGTLRAALDAKAGERPDVRGGRGAARSFRGTGAARDAVCLLCRAARRRRRAQAHSGAARARGRRRARRIPQSRARLRARRDAVAAGLRRLAARGAVRGQARHGDRARRGAGDDGARRQGPGGADRDPRRHHDAAGRLASAAAAGAAGRSTRRRARPSALVWAGPKADDVGPMAAARAAALQAARGRIPAAALRGDDARRRTADRLRRRRRAQAARRAAGTISCAMRSRRIGWRSRPTTATARCWRYRKAPVRASVRAESAGRRAADQSCCRIGSRAMPAEGTRRNPS